MKSKTFGMVAFAVLIEGIVTYISQFFADGQVSWKMLFSIVLGIIIAIMYKLDLPAYFDLNSQVPWVGCVLTGFLLSRGSNYIFDLISQISKL